MTSLPEAETIAYCKQTLSTYFKRLDDISPPPVHAYIAGEELSDLISDFEVGEVTPQDVIRGAIKVCLTQSNRINGSQASRTLGTFSYDFAAKVDIDRSEVTRLWDSIKIDD